MHRLRGRLGDPERGTSLTEMLVSMVITGIIIAAVASMTITFAQSNARNISRQDQVDTGRVVVETVSKKLRTAVMPSQLTSTCTLCTQDAFVLGKDFSVQFYANINNAGNSVGPSRVTYTLTTTGATAGTLVEKVQVPDSNTPTASGYVYCNAEIAGATAACRARLTTRTLATGVRWDTGVPIFAYYNGDGAAMLPATSGGSLTADQLSKVLSVELTVTVQAPTATRARATTYIQRLTLPNAQAILRQSEDTP
ncbi:PilW family protein [Cellulomonas terrae]|uniref:Prepilin-type N-terminal cleavage/methylation domain-containing protein n=1 Tax=Cellulomonas terrae TaxID=311234 RepID=A0A511JGM7_9CELL|nr:hypothetical protein [Cellulomonas terrae]GEL97152.1 hypothetical protein CTE05_06990 [Cellulomonas terrae]